MGVLFWMKEKMVVVLLLFFTSMASCEIDSGWLELKGKQLYAKRHIDDGLDLVDIKKVNPNIIVDIIYATKNNLTGQPIYSSSVCYVREHVAHALDGLQKELETMGFGLKIWDGFRPMSVQADCHEKFPQFFAKSNAHRAKHPRGTAVDVTLVDKNGNELVMPTEFDALVEQARRQYRKDDIPWAAVENREVLKVLMAKHGFVSLAHEWWHYDYWNWKSCDVIMLDFDEIEKELAS